MGSWGNTRHKSHRRQQHSGKLTQQQRQAIIDRIPVKAYQGQPPINRNGIAPSVKGLAPMTKTAPISTAKMQYWRNIARELITQRGHSRLIDGGHMAVGSVFMSGIRQHIEADIETCGRDYRVFIYEETTLAHTSRIQNVGTGWYFRDTKTTIVLPNGVKANLGRLRFNTPQEVVFWLCNQFYQFTADVQPRVVVGELA